MVQHRQARSQQNGKAVQIKMVQSSQPRYQEIRLVRRIGMETVCWGEGDWKQMGPTGKIYRGKDRQLNQKPLEFYNEKKVNKIRR